MEEERVEPAIFTTQPIIEETNFPILQSLRLGIAINEAELENRPFHPLPAQLPLKSILHNRPNSLQQTPSDRSNVTHPRHLNIHQ